MKVSWPDNHKFAFTIFDDTDWATIKSVAPVYEALTAFGMRTTKSVWMYKGNGASRNGGMTCEDQEYLNWAISLNNEGFEIGLHNAAPATSPRQQTHTALDRFREIFGKQQIINCNHVGCLENMYWGVGRLSGWRRIACNILTKGHRQKISRGHLEGDPLFWGDLCQERVLYKRNFVFNQLNTLAMCPGMPYHDPAKPYVNYWFASADGGSLEIFLKNFTYEKIDRLVDEGGLCIAYVHFGGGFTHNGKLDTEFSKRLKYIASKDGWFVPVSEVLDYLRMGSDKETRRISPSSLAKLEWDWLMQRVFKEVALRN